MSGGLKVSVEKPNLCLFSEEEIDQAAVKVIADKEFWDIYTKTSNGEKYYSWENFKYADLKIEGVAKELIWLTVTALRKKMGTLTLVLDENGEHYFLDKLAKSEQILHEFDLLAGRQIFQEYGKRKQRLLQTMKRNSLMEEAIASAMLEGAHTTRSAAKKMLQEDRKPRNRSEIMIVNNFLTMEMIENQFKDQEMSLEMLFQLHASLTKNDPSIGKSEKYRLRTDADEIEVGNSLDHTIAYVPPSEAFLRQQLPLFFDYLNDKDGQCETYVHPVIKAIIIHFWWAVLHPFTDGNGRLARCLFYWYLRKKGYEAVSYVPVSTAILKAPGKYAQAYLLAEQDNLNLTYFYDYHLDRIKLAITEFEQYWERKQRKDTNWREILQNEGVSKERDLLALAYLLASKADYITIKAMIGLSGVERLTASNDLRRLMEMGWLERRRDGRLVKYYPTRKLVDLS